MRHFVSGFYHTAGHTDREPPPNWIELPEGEDGKCDWCRASDEAREGLKNEAV